MSPSTPSPPEPAWTFNAEGQRVLDLLEHTATPILLTGRAGTGKSTLLQHFRACTQKKLVVLAPTGVAAVNVGGQTIHSFFGFRPGITLDNVRARSRGQSSIYKQLDMILIDEISMVRADLLDCIEKFLRLNGRHERQPFGGIQMVFIGDLYQLPPVVPEDERELFETVYASPYFFDAPAYAKANVTRVELTEVYRQRDPIFVELLDALRTGTLNGLQRRYLNRQCVRQRAQTEGAPIQLVTTNHMADQINHNYLERLAGKAQIYSGEIRGTFGERQLPTHERLRLRPQARVMLLNNDAEGRWINGDLGQIETLPGADQPDRPVRVRLDRGERVDVQRYKWEVIRFRYNPERDRIESEVMGSFTQYPLRLAWAVTIHKAQGKTFEDVVVDFGRGTFAPGQAYVALSRCTSMDGLVMRRPLESRHVFMDERITTFLRADPDEKTPPRLVRGPFSMPQ
jgi:ATP-dependent exoDNAse (exonuclease V) alpha subunit